jgi:HAD superfamily phosphoserine phosphatase-like hydrolase
MPRDARRLALFFDFDNTITEGDVLDRVIERYSVNGDWHECEELWQAGRMTSAECLHRQVAGLRVLPEELDRFAASFEIDPYFERIVRWSERTGATLQVLSDNFRPLIAAILERHDLGHVPVFANELVFSGDQPEARFPWRDPACPRCAHCKASHVRAVNDGITLYVGDGLSDICPSLAADIVFAKESLAADLERRGVAFHRFRALDDVLAFLETLHVAHLTV